MTRMELSRLRVGDSIGQALNQADPLIVQSVGPLEFRMDGTAVVLVRLEYGSECFWLLVGEGGPETFHPTPRVRQIIGWARNHWPARNRVACRG